MFDLNILPINLRNGRNLGDLPGFKLYTAPKRCEKSRKNDILIVIITSEKKEFKAKNYTEWGEVIQEAYFNARGSYTMGISAAVRAIATRLEEQFPGTLLPDILLNMVILRDRTLLVGHAGTVNTTIVYSDHVDNFSDITSLNLSQGAAGLRFFQTEIHSGDLILMCPAAPAGWTNEAILDATGESPLNVIRYLLDQARGNLQGVVIQVKTGRGEISYRTKPPITTNIRLGYDHDEDEKSAKKHAASEQDEPEISAESSAWFLSGSDDEKQRPLLRMRLPYEPLPGGISISQAQTPDINEISEPVEREETKEEQEEISDIEHDFAPPSEPSHDDASLMKEEEEEQEEISDIGHSDEKQKVKRQKKQKEKIKKSHEHPRSISWEKIVAFLLFGVIAPILIALTLFFVYTSRSKDHAYRVSLGNAVQTAKTALEQTEPALQRISWEKTLEYLNEAQFYGSSQASRDLRKQALEFLDKLDGGQPIAYHYSLANPLPSSVILKKLEATDQYLFGLDQTSGSILRFNIYSNGIALDNAFKCTPGTYKNSAQDAEEEPISVGKLVDFVILPAESGSNRIIAGIDNEANLLYCSSISGNRAAKLTNSSSGFLGINAVYFSDRTLYVLDSKNQSIWKYFYIGLDGFSTDGQSYFGSSAPNLRDITDFIIYENYAYLLRETGTLIYCDYTGYIPLCDYVHLIRGTESSKAIDLSKRNSLQIKMNASPDTSLYLMDPTTQSIANMSLKLNLIRNLTPDRFNGEGSEKTVTGFGFLDKNKIVWAARNELYVGSLP